jgi:hypothetical protein
VWQYRFAGIIFLGVLLWESLRISRAVGALVIQEEEGKGVPQ